MGRVIHFEITADDPERVGKFYRDAFGWQVQKWEGPIDYWLVGTGSEEQPGIDGAIMARDDQLPQTVNTIDVESAKGAVEKVKTAGGAVLRDVQPVPGVGYFAYCTDPDGNVFGVMEADENAG
jgi:predicted enzyme related to lactoylglutathione lyase